MKEVFFQNILIADISKKVAKWQQFSKGLNVVTGIDNHVGKSSLLKSLFYALGADVAFDSAWDQNSKLYVATINVDGNTYRIARFSGRFAVFHDEELLIITDRISSELAPLLERIFEFAVYLPNKDTKKVELAPPTFTFMPYYIDQDKGWSGLYNSFKSVARYKSDDRIKSLYYHLSIYTKTTVELMARKDNLTEQIQSLDKSRERLLTILSALQEETKSLLPAEDAQELEVQLTIPQKRIEDLVSRLGQARNEIQEYEAELIQHQHRLEVVSEYRAIKKKDAPKQIVQPETLFSCPHCGYIFNEELFNMVRANYSAVNEEYLCQQIQFIISSTQKKLESVKSNYVELMSELKKEETAYQDSKDRFDVYIRQRGLRDSIRRFTNELGAVSADKAVIETEIKKIKRELRKMSSRKDTENKYIELVRSNIISLGAWDPAYDGKIKLLRPISAQGTLENKIILSQIVALFQTMDYYKSSATRFPFVVDSPRGKEASFTSSKEILRMIVQLNMLPQIILATIDYSNFQTGFDVPTNIITLTERKKLLLEQDYIEHKKEISTWFELLKK